MSGTLLFDDRMCRAPSPTGQPGRHHQQRSAPLLTYTSSLGFHSLREIQCAKISFQANPLHRIFPKTISPKFFPGIFPKKFFLQTITCGFIIAYLLPRVPDLKNAKTLLCREYYSFATKLYGSSRIRSCMAACTKR